MQKVLMTLAVFLVLLGGCASDQGWKAAYETEKNLRQEQDARIRALETRQQPQPQSAPKQQQQKTLLTIEEILKVCQELKDNPTKYGVSCDLLDTQRREPTLAFGFTDKSTYDKNFSFIVQELGSTYCVHTASQGIDSYVSFAVFGDVRKGSIYSCRKNEYTQRWFDLPPSQPSVSNRNTY